MVHSCGYSRNLATAIEQYAMKAGTTVTLRQSGESAGAFQRDGLKRGVPFSPSRRGDPHIAASSAR